MSNLSDGSMMMFPSEMLANFKLHAALVHVMSIGTSDSHLSMCGRIQFEYVVEDTAEFRAT